MNLFSTPKVPKPAPLPSLDEAQASVDAMKRDSQMQGRAANMLVTGGSAPTVQRSVTGY